MKNIIKGLLTASCALLLVFLVGGCKKLGGLDLQENVDHPTHTIDPRLNKTAWQYIKERSSGNPDSIFSLMYQGILYSGIDTNEYTKTGRTFILLNNGAVDSVISGKVSVACYFGHYLVNGLPGTKWQDYSPAQVKIWLQYLILTKNYNYNFGSPINAPDLVVLNAYNVTAPNLMPPGSDTLNPQSTLLIALTDDRNSSVVLNNFAGSAYPTIMRTSGYVLTNGSAHVAQNVVYFQQK
ncbi:MAG TPA: hypothetical protein VL832_03650 [Puia sp.]|jgi:hypothetical protein|nr:hypothetical protein [Puia sp.]